MSREQGEYLDIVMSEWGAEGAERRKLRESMATLQKNLERANASLAQADRGGRDDATRVPQSGVLEKVARIEAEAKRRAIGSERGGSASRPRGSGNASSESAKRRERERGVR